MFDNIKEVDNFKKHNKTRLCKNINNCPYGDMCHYAHSIDEIVMIECAYKNECIFISEKSSGCCNSNVHKTCFFKHPCETVQEYHKRVGNIKEESDKTLKIEPTFINLSDKKIDNSWTKVTHKKKTQKLEDDYTDIPVFVKAKDLLTITLILERANLQL